MMKVVNSPLKLVGLSQGAASGVQAIVNLEFRKEHRALLKLFEDLKTRTDKISAEAERRLTEYQKQLEESETRFEKLENESKELMQKIRRREDELKDLKDRMMKFTEFMEAGICATYASSPQGRLHDTDAQQTQLSPVTASPAHDLDVAEAQHPESLSTIASLQTGSDAPGVTQIPSASTTEQLEPVAQPDLPSPPVDKTALEEHSQCSGNRRESRELMPSLAHSGQTILPALPLQVTASPANERTPVALDMPLRKAGSRKVWHNISQAPDQNVETYLAHAEKYIGAIKQRADHFQFIARFIKGLLNEKDRAAVIKHLQKKFQSRITEDGLVEVKCGFLNLKDGLLAAGLIETMGGKRNCDDSGMKPEVSTLRQKRRKTQSSEENDDEL
ncbi:751e1b82-90c8-40d8-bdba-01abec7313b4 [Sclerotinia trifoliorum]|uniref:751e1b82-90c8-40d8-bdba-01abec7313b4 n=1 Tax=Sclerotinia trifoliorum TaxID=28548 RepID=A0A8H2ZQW1_9HELO|nr:751e1b82-90c8-40d8-bdba-01abec7313b4 [Sclerotinia trifoliorum]